MSLDHTMDTADRRRRRQDVDGLQIFARDSESRLARSAETDQDLTLRAYYKFAHDFLSLELVESDLVVRKLYPTLSRVELDPPFSERRERVPDARYDNLHYWIHADFTEDFEPVITEDGRTFVTRDGIIEWLLDQQEAERARAAQDDAALLETLVDYARKTDIDDADTRAWLRLAIKSMELVVGRPDITAIVISDFPYYGDSAEVVPMFALDAVGEPVMERIDRPTSPIVVSSIHRLDPVVRREGLVWLIDVDVLRRWAAGQMYADGLSQKMGYVRRLGTPEMGY